MSTNANLALFDVHKRYGEITVLNGVSLMANPGETVAIVGPSGSGKSTLLNLIGALDQPTSGSIRLGEIEVSALRGPGLTSYRASRVGFVFQDHHLLPQLTALENVLLPSLAAKPSGTAAARARALLEQMGVAHRADAFPAQMSGGERQRVAIARALINGPSLLLCDEPTGNLDQATGAAIVAIFLDLARQEKLTILMVTHNLEHAKCLARCLALKEGRLG
jgi:ABC-type lipoprotein export system ATPase subunit